MIIQANANPLWTAMTYSKLMKSEFVIIPRGLFQQSPSTSMMGLSYGSIVTLSNFEDFKYEVFHTLWDNPILPWIVYEGKEVNHFSQGHTLVYPNAEIDTLQFNCDTYFTGENIAIATSMQREANSTVTMEMFPYNPVLGKINSMLFAFANSSTVVKNVPLTDNQEFMDIANAKAGIGAMIWVPKIPELTEEKATEYTMTLTGTLLNIAKGDQVYMTIVDRLSGHSGYNFIVRFDVHKPKKKCVLSYFMMMLKVGSCKL